MKAVTWVNAKTKTKSKNNSSGATLACSVPCRTAGCGACIPTFCRQDPVPMIEGERSHDLRNTAISAASDQSASPR